MAAQTMGRNYKGDVILSDDEVRLARTMSEHEGKSKETIAAHFDVDPVYIGRILSYQIRSRIYIDPPPLKDFSKPVTGIAQSILLAAAEGDSVSFGALAATIDSRMIVSDAVKILRDRGFLSCEFIGGADGFSYKVTDSGNTYIKSIDTSLVSRLKITAPVEKKRRVRISLAKEKPKPIFQADPLSSALNGMASARMSK